MNSFQAKIGWKRMRKIEIKILVPFHSYPTRNTKFQKNSQKIQNIKKNTNIATFLAKIGWKKMRNRENKNYRSISFLPDA